MVIILNECGFFLFRVQSNKTLMDKTNFFEYKALLYFKLLNALDISPQIVESRVYILITPIDLIDVVNGTFSASAHRCNQQRNSGPNIG